MPLIACLTASLLACYSAETDRSRVHAPTLPSQFEFLPQYDHDLFQKRAGLIDPDIERFGPSQETVRVAAVVYSDVLGELQEMQRLEDDNPSDKKAKNRMTDAADKPAGRDKPEKSVIAPEIELAKLEPQPKKRALSSKSVETANGRNSQRTRIVIEQDAERAYAGPETKKGWLSSLFNSEFNGKISGNIPKAKGIDTSKEGYREVIKAAKEEGVPVDLALRVAKQESGGNCSVTSHAGAGGVMQVMPKTARKHGVTSFKDIYDCRTGARTGVRELKHLLKLSNGDVKQTLIGYNCGERCMNGKRKKLPAETVNYVAVIAGR